MTFKDHFSGHADRYEAFRPTYPDDAVVHRLDTDILGPFWLPEVRLVEEGYRTMPFPFQEIGAPAFHLTQWWSLDRLMGCMETWSASLCYRNQTGQNPIDPFREDLAAAWGDPDRQREIVWPLHMRVGRISGR